MKNNFIKSLMNSLNSREREREKERKREREKERKRERERERSFGGFFMKKESNGIGENKNSKKINKNNKIISSILAVIMCCQSFVGAFVSDDQLVDNRKTVEIMEGKDNDVKENDKGEDEGGNENKIKNKSLIDKFNELSGLAKAGFGTICSIPGVGALVCVVRYAISPIGKIKIGGKYYKTCNIGRLVDEDVFNGGRCENLDESGSLCEFKESIRKSMGGGGEQKSIRVSFCHPGESDSAKIGDVKKKVMEQLESEYSKFIYRIITKEKVAKNITTKSRRHAYELLRQAGPGFRLVNIVINGYGIQFFLVPEELVEVLKGNGYTMVEGVVI
ncbi:MAG: hypothetical protein CfP315_0433 [Candidatus Improbicoccus pseudotrichonymphae]|uniref:Uncharacterized protein n=1 Tax=Candidatus Improbicoccus pseudotrichonymphae TaxID=3033792 RepID=A0AA48L0W0_9FIRM|nr:MAG: hypothetical protein CfP315_0433 [Candidatus Improbicoccus pseudotrichonymphae]